MELPKPKRICLDPGHGMSNTQHLRYDPGVTHGNIQEADIAMRWVNCLRGILKELGHTVIRTRVDDMDPAPVSRRDDIAAAYKCEMMISFHVNCCGGKGGTETFYRGEDDKAFAQKLNNTVVKSMGTINRGAKTEAGTQHKSLAIMNFDKCWLIELGFMDNLGDRTKMLDETVMYRTCRALALVIEAY